MRVSSCMKQKALCLEQLFSCQIEARRLRTCCWGCDSRSTVSWLTVMCLPSKAALLSIAPMLKQSPPHRINADVNCSSSIQPNPVLSIFPFGKCACATVRCLHKGSVPYLLFSALWCVLSPIALSGVPGSCVFNRCYSIKQFLQLFSVR